MKRFLGVLVAPAMLIGSLVAFAPPAEATGGCHWTQTAKSASLTCSAMVFNEWRAGITCRRVSSSTLSYTAYGPWRGQSGTSTATCSRASDDYRTSDVFLDYKGD